MDGDVERFRRRLAELYDEAVEVAVRLDAAERSDAQLPHFCQLEAAIEARVNQLGRLMVERTAREVTAEAPAEAKCPGCGATCRLETSRRTVQSLHGETELLEAVGDCNRCRRSFFPSADPVGLGQSRNDADAREAGRVRRGRNALR